MFVGGLPPDLTEDEFSVYFKKFGVVNDATIIKDKNTGRSRGFGFITFRDAGSVYKVMRSRRTTNLKGKWVDCKTIFDYESYCYQMKTQRMR